MFKRIIDLIGILFIVRCSNIHDPCKPKQANSTSLGIVFASTTFPYKSYDTIQVPDSFKKYRVPSEIRSIIDKGSSDLVYTYAISGYCNNQIIYCIEDEGEVISISMYLISDNILKGKLMVAQKSKLELSDRIIKSIISNDSIITRIEYSYSQNLKNCSKSKYDTLINKFVIKNNGLISKK